MFYIKGRIFVYLILLNILLIAYSNAQNKKWENIIDGGKKFTSILEEEDFIWVGTDIGLMKVKKNDNSIEIFDKTSGLPDNYITAITIDKNGNKWFGVSGKGLVKYNDNNFTNYNASNSGLPSNNVSALYVDKKGNIWIGCSQLISHAYLVKYDGTNWIVFNSNNSTLPAETEITSITEDSTGLWVGTKGGLVRFDGISWSIYKTSNSGIPSLIINSVVVDKYNNKWLGLFDGIAKYNDTTWTAIVKDTTTPLYNNEVFVISIDSNNNLWLGTYKGLIKYDQNNWTIYNTDNSDLPANQIDIVMVDTDNNKWIGCFDWNSNGRLVKFDDQDWTIFKTWKGELNSNYINFIKQDNNGKIWIGTDRNLCLVSGNKWDTFTWDDTLNYGDYYGYNSCAMDGKGDFWFSIYSDRPIGTPPISGLLKYNGINWTVFRPYNSGLPVSDVNAIDYSETDNALWLATSEGPIKYDGISWTLLDTIQNIIHDSYLRTIKIDGNIKWLGSNYGLIKFDNKNWQLYNTDNSGLPDNRIEDIDIDSNRNLWISTLNGLAKYDGNHWTVYNKSNSGLEDNWIRTVTIDENGILWIGTNNGGLTIYDGVNWQTYNKENSPLVGNQVNCIEKDSNGNLWLSCFGDGISIFNESGIVDVAEQYHNELPQSLMLFQNYPNPFNLTTSIEYRVGSNEHVSLKVYDILGNEVATLVDEYQQPGKYKVTFNGQRTTDNRQLSSGVYFYRLQAGNFTAVKKLILMK